MRNIVAAIATYALTHPLDLDGLAHGYDPCAGSRELAKLRAEEDARLLDTIEPDDDLMVA